MVYKSQKYSRKQSKKRPHPPERMRFLCENVRPEMGYSLYPHLSSLLYLASVVGRSLMVSWGVSVAICVVVL